MPNKKGFTLVELLAIIAILALIAITTFPAVSGAINRSKDRAYESQVKLVEDAASGYVSKHISELFPNNEEFAYVSLTTLKAAKAVQNKKVTNPKTGEVMNGCVKVSKDTYGQYKVKYYEKSCDSIGAPKKYNVGAVVYYNPETNQKCSSSEVNGVPNAKTGCLRWNVITTNDNESMENINIMLDHNTTPVVAWNSTGNSSAGMKEAATALQADIATWNSNIKTTARLISGQEIADIAKNSSWTSAGTTVVSLTDYAWLYQNTYGNGDDTTWAYWTSTAHSTNTSHAWMIGCSGGMDYIYTHESDVEGIRPVITVSKIEI